MAVHDETTIRANWKCFVACGIMILAPFQYGLDFGLIGGLQAMIGFLKVNFLFDTKLMMAYKAPRAEHEANHCLFRSLVTRHLKPNLDGISLRLDSSSSRR